MRFNTFYDKGDRPDRDVADSGRWGFAPSLALGLGGETRAYFNFLFTKQNNTPDGGLPTIGLFDYSYSPIATPRNLYSAADPQYRCPECRHRAAGECGAGSGPRQLLWLGR